MADPRARHIVLGAAMVHLIRDEVALAMDDLMASIRTKLLPNDQRTHRRRKARKRGPKTGGLGHMRP
jgi:hypothetical protein